jgi:UDP-N-acetylglucosamine--N-acetylmuramyl-(pentapeptide) pyrophosphoryl-undecaprenol N-acetylglucosamine transferase
VAVFAGGGTGGHLYPALALADALVAIRPDVRPFFVGARRGVEARVLPARGLEHVLLPVRGLRRDNPFANAGVLWDLLRSLLQARRLFRRLRPGLVVVTGGYAGAPAGILAGRMGIPLVLHEANSYPGVTIRRLAPSATAIHLGFPEARDRLPASARGRTVTSGNPIRPPGQVGRDQGRHAFGLQPAATVLLVVGGSQGSRALNDLVLAAVEAVVAGRLVRPAALQLLWATGPDHFGPVRRRLEAAGDPVWVKATDYIHRMPEALAATDLALSRAGAMFTSEFLAWGIPAVLVPLPTAAEDHQTQNAKVLAEAGVAVHLAEAELTSESLWKVVTDLSEDADRRTDMARRARDRGHPSAAHEIARSLAALLAPPADHDSAPAPRGPRGQGGASVRGER